MDEISIEKARPVLGDLVHAAESGTAVCITRHGRPAAMVVPVTRLADADRRIIARAHELVKAQGTEGLRAVAGSDPDADWSMVRAEAFGAAKFLLAELTTIIDRLDGQPAAQVTQARDG